MYKEIIVETTSQGADFVAGIFFSLGASGVKIDDPNDIDEVINSKNNWDYIEQTLLDNRGGAVKVSCFVSLEDCARKIEQIQQQLAEISGIDMGSLSITVQDYTDYDWLTEWKKYYKPIAAGSFTVVPAWQSYTPAKDETIIKIDPGMAFGTGDHESTKLCLTLMSQLDFCGKQVIDVGTGSGILGIAAALKGAKHCYMCDIDSLAIRSAADNARLNNVQDSVTIQESDLISNTAATGDIVLANLTADILLRLASDLPKHICKGGLLVCSGIIHKKKDGVIAAFQDAGMRLVTAADMGDWDALLLRQA